MLRKEKREQSLIFFLITGAVALSLVGAFFVRSSAATGEAIKDQGFVTFDGEQAEVERITELLGDRLTPIGLGDTRIDGSTDWVQLRGHDSDHAQIAGAIDLLTGRFPEGPDQIAVTDGSAAVLRAGVDETVTLDGVSLRITGIVEDPGDLNSEFVFFDVDDPPALSLSLGYLTSATREQILDLGYKGEFELQEAFGSEQAEATILGAIVTTFAMLLVGLLASASFGVVAQRRVRQYGLLGVIGADERHLRGAAAFNGFALGVISASVGVVLGSAAAAALLPRLEDFFGRRVVFTVPVGVWAPSVVVAILVATVSSWWPARAIARQPAMEALAARRPHSRPTRGTSVLGVVTVVLGYGLLGYALGQPQGGATEGVAIGGVLFAVAGVLLLTPAAISLIGRLVTRAVLPLRIAGRDLARFQSRAAAALGAIVMALAIPLAVGMGSASWDAEVADEAPNLGADTAIVWSPGVLNEDTVIQLPTSLDSSESDETVARISEALPRLIAAEIRVPLDPLAAQERQDSGTPMRLSSAVYTRVDCSSTEGHLRKFGEGPDQLPTDCFLAESPWVATPALANLWSFDLETFDGNGLLTTSTEALFRETPGASVSDRDFLFVEESFTSIDLPDFTSLPTTLIAESAIAPHHDVVTVGWLFSGDTPFTDDEIAALRSAATGGAAIETLAPFSTQSRLRAVFAVVGMLVGLSVLGATVTLIRGESADDDRVLDVLGATGRTRRSIAGATAGLLAIGGAVLAAPLSLVGLIVARAAFRSGLPLALPWSTIAVLFVVFPVLAAIATGLSAGGLPLWRSRVAPSPPTAASLAGELS